MPIPNLTDFGLLPPGQHSCTFQEIGALYTYNDHRAQLWDQFTQFYLWVDDQPNPETMLIDGGFTSDKTTPKDINIVLDLSNCDLPTEQFWLYQYATQRDFFEAAFRVDLWVYLPGINRDLRAFFAYVKPAEALERGLPADTLKGMLKVSL